MAHEANWRLFGYNGQYKFTSYLLLLTVTLTKYTCSPAIRTRANLLAGSDRNLDL